MRGFDRLDPLLYKNVPLHFLTTVKASFSNSLVIQFMALNVLHE